MGLMASIPDWDAGSDVNNFFGSPDFERAASSLAAGALHARSPADSTKAKGRRLKSWGEAHI